MCKRNDKAELMLVTSKRTKNLNKLPNSITIGNAQIPFRQSVNNLCFPSYWHLIMDEHVTIIAGIC